MRHLINERCIPRAIARILTSLSLSSRRFYRLHPLQERRLNPMTGRTTFSPVSLFRKLLSPLLHIHLSAGERFLWRQRAIMQHRKAYTEPHRRNVLGDFDVNPYAYTIGRYPDPLKDKLIERGWWSLIKTNRD